MIRLPKTIRVLAVAATAVGCGWELVFDRAVPPYVWAEIVVGAVVVLHTASIGGFRTRRHLAVTCCLIAVLVLILPVLAAIIWSRTTHVSSTVQLLCWLALGLHMIAFPAATLLWLLTAVSPSEESQ